MLVFDIKPDEFEYAFSFDGPYEPAKGLCLTRKMSFRPIFKSGHWTAKMGRKAGGRQGF